MPLDKDFVQQRADLLFSSVLEVLLESGSGHLGASLSSKELMAVVYFSDLFHLNPDCSSRDRILVRGHLGPLRYPIFAMKGWINRACLTKYRKFGSPLQGHEDMEVRGVDLTPSGSLGMLLSYGVGLALEAKRRDNPFNTIVFLGDGEEQEGQVSEAARHASSLGLSNLIVCLDKNGKQLSGVTSVNDLNTNHAVLWKAYGWHVIELDDGHDIDKIYDAFTQALGATKPSIIIAKTIKAKGVEGAKDSPNGYHTIPKNYKELLQKELSRTCVDSSDCNWLSEDVDVRECCAMHKLLHEKQTIDVSIDVRHEVMLADLNPAYWRQAGKILKDKLPPLLVADLIPAYAKERISKGGTEVYDVGIREQHLISMAYGMWGGYRDRKYTITFGDSFLYRAADQIAAAALGGGGLILLSGHPGLFGTKNGKTHQSSGQPGMMQTMPGVRHLEPYDGNDYAACLNVACSENGFFYIRVHAAKVSSIAKSEICRWPGYTIPFEDSDSFEVMLISSGATVGEALNAQRVLSLKYGVRVLVVNALEPKQIKNVFLKINMPQRCSIVTIYNGNPNVLKWPVLDALSEIGCSAQIRALGFMFGTTGQYEELVEAMGVSKRHIVNTVLELLRS